MKTFMKSYLLPAVAFTAFAMMPLAGCNTVEGAGEDISEAGDAVEDAAE